MKRSTAFVTDRTVPAFVIRIVTGWLVRRPAEVEPPEFLMCTRLAAELEISEYELFRQASEWYYGRVIDSVESGFGAYLLSGCEILPLYVTHFIRRWRPGVLAA